MTQSVDEIYPHLARWVDAFGWVEIGHDEFSRSCVRALASGCTTRWARKDRLVRHIPLIPRHIPLNLTDQRNGPPGSIRA